MTGPGQPRTCSHPINAQTLIGICQAVRMFSPCQFHVYVSIGTLVNDLLSQSTHVEPNGHWFIYDTSINTSHHTNITNDHRQHYS